MSLDAVIITADLAYRPYRSPNYEAENLALRALMEQLASSPSGALDLLVQTALSLCRAQSAGVSIEENQDGLSVFRWHAVAGEWTKYLGGTMPRDASPCGTVLDLNCALLMARPHLHYPIPPDVEPRISEVLLVPFRSKDKPVGTIWIIHHDEHRKFDREDLRVMTSLSAFAGAGFTILGGKQDSYGVR